jgi:CHAT domain-containing protein
VRSHRVNPFWEELLPAALLLFLFASGCAVEQSKFQPTSASTREAIAAGQVREGLSAMEARALEAEKSAVSSLFSNRHWEEAASSYNEAAFMAWSSGLLQKAIAHGKKALEIAERLKDPELKVRAIYYLVFAHRSLGQHQEARGWTDKGIEVVKQIPTPMVREVWEGQYYRLSGLDFLRGGAFQKAIQHFSYSLQVQERRLDFLKSVRGYGRLNPDAIPNAQNLVVLSLNSLGSAYHRAGHVEDAIKTYEKGIRFMKESQIKSHGEAYLYQGLGRLYARKKEFDRALENFHKALQISEERHLGSTLYQISSDLGNLLLRAQRPSEAIPYYKKAIENVESTRSLLESEEFRSSFFEDKREIYAGMILAHSQARNFEEAFNYSERARSRVFLDVLGSKVQLSRVKSGLLEEERTLQERLAGLRARLAGEEEGRGKATLRRELGEAETAYNAFLAKVRRGDKEQASLMSVEPLTLKEVQELLDPEATLIEYFVTEDRIFVWVVEKDNLQHMEIELSRKKLAGLVKTLRETVLTLGEKEKFNEASSSLYKRLIQAVLPHISGKELIIVPHDVLHYLPFHALLSPNGQYLIEDFPIYYLSSASLLQFTTAKRRAKGERVLALGNPDLGDPKMNLRFAEREAKELQRLYPQSTVLLRKDASEERGKSLSPQHDILHFATHAELSEEDPLSSAILLAKGGKEDGRLEVREVFGMDLKANLVVLSACETGLGKLSSGDEIVGLTRAFIYAGTPSVVASLWKVEDSSTAAIMGSFYENLKTKSKVEALRQAQLELIRGQATSDLQARRGIGGIGKLGEASEKTPQAPESISILTSHPYFWAPFILVGDGK